MDVTQEERGKQTLLGENKNYKDPNYVFYEKKLEYKRNGY